MPTLRRALAPLLLLALAAPASAAAAPDNDDRAQAQRVPGLPARLLGDLRDATREREEPGEQCGSVAASVWYRLDPGQTRRLVLRLAAQGDLDASLDVFERVRSDLTAITCEQTDTRGNAAVAFRGVRGHSYLVRVARRQGSVADAFALSAVGVAGGLGLPGPALPVRGVSATLDRLQRTANAWSSRLTAGVRYRVALSHPGGACIGGAILGPRARMGDEPLATLGCEGYALFTPRRSGRYSVVVRAAEGVRGLQPYRLQIARGGADDSAPGRRLENYTRLRARLDGRRTDRLDLYAFDVTRRSVLFLRLAASAQRRIDLRLIGDDGREIKCTCGGSGAAELRKGLYPGHYFVAVRAKDRTQGAYTLLRAVRTITKTSVSAFPRVLAPGGAATLTASVAPGVNGPVRFELQQLDPLAGWQFVRTVRGQASGGVATAAVPVPSAGRWRARARYLGTRENAPSITGFAPFTVELPLQP